MKFTLKYSIRTLGIAALVVGLAGIGCSSPSAEPSYQSTDIKTKAVPPVKSPFRGSRVAAVPFTNRTLSRYRFLGDATVDLIPENLIQAGFRPIEASTKGSELDKVLDELKYSQSANVDPTKAVAVGKHLGAQYVFVGGVNNYKEVKASGNKGVNLGGFALGGGQGTITYDIQVSGRLVSVETREIIASTTVAHSETFKVQGGRVRTPWGGFNQSESIKVQQEVGGKVLNHAMNRMMIKIVNQINSRPVN